MISQIAFDLPLEGSFDYSIPSSLENHLAIGMRVQVFFGPKKRIGIVTALLAKSAFESLKPIHAIIDEKPLLDQAQMVLAEQLSRYYGCSLGEALFSLARANEQEPSIKSSIQRRSSAQCECILHIVPLGNYEQILLSLIKPLAQKGQRVLILAADQFAVSSINDILKKHFSTQVYLIGTRSFVFRSFVDVALVIMIDEDNLSFKQEQTPMYETREVLLMRKAIEHIDIAFVGETPSVELMYQVKAGYVKMIYDSTHASPVQVQVVDLNNYKFTPKGLLSVPIKSTIEQNLNKKEKTILVLNRKGSYAVTRCEDCGFILKCDHCDAAMSYSRLKGKYSCHYCSFTVDPEVNCPHCQKPSWKSIGMGVEQLQKELKNAFGLARVACFEREVPSRGKARSPRPNEPLPRTPVLMDFDILITTQAVLRYKHQWRVNTIILIDLDSQLNRMDLRSSFRAWSLAQHLRSMAKTKVFIQTRNRDHYVIKALAGNDPNLFYDEDMSIRQELKLAPFGHEVSIGLRSKIQTIVQNMAQELYDRLKNVAASPPSEDTISKKRDQYRFNILMRGEDVVGMIATIKAALTKIKRKSQVIVTINVDP